MDGTKTGGSAGPGIGAKIGFPLLIALITLAAAHWGGMGIGNALDLAAVVGFGLAFILFIVDTEARFAAVG